MIPCLAHLGVVWGLDVNSVVLSFAVVVREVMRRNRRSVLIIFRLEIVLLYFVERKVGLLLLLLVQLCHVHWQVRHTDRVLHVACVEVLRIYQAVGR